jgi:hypothetical protein
VEFGGNYVETALLVTGRLRTLQYVMGQIALIVGDLA